MPYADYDYAVATYGLDYVVTSCDRDLDGNVDATALTLAFAQATSRINGYLAGRVSLPLEPVPENIKLYCVDMAIYTVSSTADVMTTIKKERYELAISDLKLIAQGKMRLVRDPDAPVPDIALTQQASVETERERAAYLNPTTRTFSRTRTGVL